MSYGGQDQDKNFGFVKRYVLFCQNIRLIKNFSIQTQVTDWKVIYFQSIFSNCNLIA